MKHGLIRLAAVAAIFAAGVMASSCSGEKELVKGEIALCDSVSVPYQMSVPYEGLFHHKRPLLLFLHGAGERGCDNQSQLKHGGELLLSSPELKNVIVIAPQCPEGMSWAKMMADSSTDENGNTMFAFCDTISEPLAAVKGLIDSLVCAGKVDTRRIYCTGLSMGGMGTFDLLLRYPDFFAAAEPICGAVNLKRLSQWTGNTPVRLFHGDADPTVPVYCSRMAYKTLKDAGKSVEYKEYPGVQHNSWDNAFAEPDFLSWMLSKRK